MIIDIVTQSRTYAGHPAPPITRRQSAASPVSIVQGLAKGRLELAGWRTSKMCGSRVRTIKVNHRALLRATPRLWSGQIRPMIIIFNTLCQKVAGLALTTEKKGG